MLMNQAFKKKPYKMQTWRFALRIPLVSKALFFLTLCPNNVNTLLANY